MSWITHHLQNSLVLLLAAMPPAVASDAAPGSLLMNFEADAGSWTARAASISVTREQEPGATSESAAHLRVQGRIQKGWNYALSEHQAIRAGQLCRLTAWLRVDRLGPGTPPPYLKCEFVGSAESRSPGQVHTEPYDTSRPGQWQQLQAEFEVPAGTSACWLALEKGSDQAAEIDARLDDIRLQTIERLSVLEQYRLAPLPAGLVQMRGVHPRAYLDADRLAGLREAIKTTHAPLWREVRASADRAAGRKPPAFREDDGSSGGEQLWQREVGNAMPLLAMAYVLSGQRQYLDAARQWALASCSYPTWGSGRIDGMDLATGHQLFGLAIVYDWCHTALDDADRRTIRETIQRRGSAMFEAAATGKAWWRRSYLQNHLWVNACGLAAAGWATFDEVPDAELWIGLAQDKFRRTMEALGSDGASHEGVGYWEYGAEYLLKFMELSRPIAARDWYDHPWWQSTASYPLYLGLPRDAWTRSNCIVDFADCPRGHWYGPDHVLRRLAAQYADPHAQWLAEEIDRADVAAPSAGWLNLIWYDPTVPATPPSSLPTLHHFEDMGIVSARSDWSGGESLAVLKCGPFLGHEAVEQFAYDPGGGHVHPDANHFVLFGGGQWLIRDDGYRWKWTAQHNTLLVAGRGQLGEGQQWFQGSQPLAVKARPRILRAVSSPELDHLVGDAAAAYPAELGLERFQRHLLFLKPDVLIVADEVRLAASRELELRFYPEQQQGERDEHAVVLQGPTATLRLEPFCPEAVEIRAEPVQIADRQGQDESLFALRLMHTAAHWRNAVAISWASQDRPVPLVEFTARGDAYVFRSGQRTVSLDWSRGEAAVVEHPQP